MTKPMITPPKFMRFYNRIYSLYKETTRKETAQKTARDYRASGNLVRVVLFHGAYLVYIAGR